MFIMLQSSHRNNRYRIRTTKIVSPQNDWFQRAFWLAPDQWWINSGDAQGMCMHPCWPWSIRCKGGGVQKNQIHLTFKQLVTRGSCDTQPSHARRLRAIVVLDIWNQWLIQNQKPQQTHAAAIFMKFANSIIHEQKYQSTTRIYVHLFPMTTSKVGQASHLLVCFAEKIIFIFIWHTCIKMLLITGQLIKPVLNSPLPQTPAARNFAPPTFSAQRVNFNIADLIRLGMKKCETYMIHDQVRIIISNISSQVTPWLNERNITEYRYSRLHTRTSARIAG